MTSSSIDVNFEDSSTAASFASSDSSSENSIGDDDVPGAYPFTYLYHYNGGTLGQTNMIGSLTLNPGNKPVRHKITPLMMRDNDENALRRQRRMKPVPLASVDSRSEFVNLLAAVAASPTTNKPEKDDGARPVTQYAQLTQYVAIRNEQGRYVSCRRMGPNGSSLAEYRNHLGEFEQFILEHNVAKGTFSFKSHNGLYLHYNKTLRTVSFKPKDMNWATWMIHPLGLTRPDDQETNMEHIIFVGVIEHGWSFVYQRLAEGMKPDQWKIDFDTIIKTIMEEVPVGGCSIFPHPITSHQWCIAKYDGDTVGIVVSTDNFPQSLATECHDDLTLWYKNSKDPKKMSKIQKMGLDLDRIAGKELAALMADYDEQYYVSIRKNTKLTKLEQDMLDLQNKMTQNIRDLQTNVESVEALNSKSHDLLEQSKLFKKQTEKLPTSWKHATILVGASLGAGTGALAGWLLGGPGGALILATEGLEIATGAATAAVLGGSIGATTVVSFWSRKFVRLIFPPPRDKKLTKMKARAAAAKIVV